MRDGKKIKEHKASKRERIEGKIFVKKRKGRRKEEEKR